MASKRTWTNIGAEYSEEHRGRLARAFDSLEWQALPIECGMLPGEGIKHAIREFRMPKVSHVAISHELAPYGLYGIRAHYSNGDAQIYILDRGSDLLPLASDFEPRGA